MNFCDILKQLREEKGVTQKVVAKNCNLTATCICQLESGVRNPTGSTLKALAQYFNVSADYLLGIEDDFGIKQNGISQEEENVLAMFAALTEDEKKVFTDMLKRFAENSNKAKHLG